MKLKKFYKYFPTYLDCVIYDETQEKPIWEGNFSDIPVWIGNRKLDIKSAKESEVNGAIDLRVFDTKKRKMGLVIFVKKE